MALVSRLVEHWQLKLLSIGFAVGLWMLVASEDKGDGLYTVALNLMDVPPGLEVATIGTETVDVRVEGRRGVLARVQDRDLRAQVALKDARPGEMIVRVLPQDVTAPRGVKVVRVTPSRVRLTLEAVTRGRVDVAPRVVGQPAAGFQVVRVDVEPRQVEVRVAGADATLTRSVETVPVDIDGARETVRREVGLRVPAGVELTERTRPRVAVTVEVVQR